MIQIPANTEMCCLAITVFTPSKNQLDQALPVVLSVLLKVEKAFQWMQKTDMDES